MIWCLQYISTYLGALLPYGTLRYLYPCREGESVWTKQDTSFSFLMRERLKRTFDVNPTYGHSLLYIYNNTSFSNSWMHNDICPYMHDLLKRNYIYNSWHISFISRNYIYNSWMHNDIYNSCIVEEKNHQCIMTYHLLLYLHGSLLYILADRRTSNEAGVGLDNGSYEVSPLHWWGSTSMLIGGVFNTFPEHKYIVKPETHCTITTHSPVENFP